MIGRSLASLVATAISISSLVPSPVTGLSAAQDHPEDEEVIVVAAEGSSIMAVADDLEGVDGAMVQEMFGEIGSVAVTATAEAVAELKQLPTVEAVVMNLPVSPALDESVPFVGATAAWARGFTGAGSRVAVIDTGVAVAHPALAGAVIGEACFAPSGSLCPNGSTSQVGPGSATPGACSGCGHGTHVAGIVASSGQGSAPKGVAPGAEVMAINVFDRPNVGTPGADYGSLLAALDHVASNAAAMGIVAVNLSLTAGTGYFPGSCDEEPTLLPLRNAVERLHELGVATIAAAGNNGAGATGRTGALRAPGCLSRVVTVSSVTTGPGPTVSGFADVGPQVDLLAPGDSITSTVPGGIGILSGTSMAAPHLTAGVALLHQRHPDAHPRTLAQLIADSGPMVTGPRGSYPRMDLGAVLTRATGDSLILRRNNLLMVRNVLTSGPPNRAFAYGRPGDVVLMGDWDGDGVDTPGVRRGATYHLSNTNASGAAEITFTYGRPEDEVLVGDWDGDGRDTLAVRRGRTYYFSNLLRGGPASTVVIYGRADDVVVSGDWDGDGRDTLGVRRGRAYHLRSSLTSGPGDMSFMLGRQTDAALVGDWDGDGTDSISVRRGTTTYVSNQPNGSVGWSFNFGAVTDTVMAGNTDGF